MMNRYTGEPLFIDPKVDQYGSHMVMRNVSRPDRTSFITIDTRFGDDYTSNNIISLPNCICDVKSIRVVSAEIPMSYYNISAALGNNCFTITNTANVVYIIIIPDGNYATTAALSTALGTALTTAGLLGISYTVISGQSQFTAISDAYTLAFDVDSTGATDKYNFKDKLGWLLGLRTQSSAILSGATFIAPALVNISPIKYLYIAVDDFSSAARAAMLGAVSRALIDRRILGRVAVNTDEFPFGSVLFAHAARGSLITDKREYMGKTDLQRFCVQLVSPCGKAINLNGLDFSFVLEIEHA
jgi:hypothetical protein